MVQVLHMCKTLLISVFDATCCSAAELANEHQLNRADLLQASGEWAAWAAMLLTDATKVQQLYVTDNA